MTFKKLMEEDADAMLEVCEFAELAEVDGVLLKVQLDLWTEKYSGAKSENYTGLAGDYANLYFKTCDYVRKKRRYPRQGEWVRVRGKRYEVQKAHDEQGVSVLELKAYRQGQVRNVQDRS